MGGAVIPSTIRSRIIRLLFLRIRPAVIAQEVKCHIATVYRIQENVFVYGSPFRPSFRKQGKPRKITKAAGESLIEYLEEQPWTQQKEMVWYLWEEWGLDIHRTTISRFLKRERLSLIFSSPTPSRCTDGVNKMVIIAWRRRNRNR